MGICILSKLVLKTAAVTLAAIIFLCALIFGAFVLFRPVSLARLFEGAGNDSAAAYFYIRSYEKTGDFEELALLCEKIDEHDMSEDAAKYLSLFIENEKFADYCEEYDAKYSSYYSAREAAYGRLTVSIYLSEGIESALLKAKQLCEGNYSEYNPFYWLITDGSLSFSETDVASIKTALRGIECDESEREFLERDIALAEELSAK